MLALLELDAIVILLKRPVGVYWRLGQVISWLDLAIESSETAEFGDGTGFGGVGRPVLYSAADLEPLSVKVGVPMAEMFQWPRLQSRDTTVFFAFIPVM